MYFKNKTVLITGASRGIGKSVALRLAAEGANIIIAAKSTAEDGRLGGTIFATAKEVEAAGGKALPVFCDIRDEKLIQELMEKSKAAFGGIDILINNASAINLSNTAQLEPKRFDLMFDINVRGTFMVTKYAYPLLKAAVNPHILTLSPPLSLDMKWFKPHLAYTISKFNMSLMSMGWAEEFRIDGIASNTLWPATTIATAAVKNILGGEELVRRSRKPDIVSDAAFYILQKDAKSHSGNSYLDEDVLREAGISDMDSYAITPGGNLQPDLFL
ncbi:MAG: NAD(P)-dependent oxidoreductase [Bacteroidota bacterium]|nr:NAD(P)-dependent oxidoreductase [Bacteroidota bacterium]MDP4213332.1 NAD(P)-dependent oxidoreductase [Bacteroidota bacterium]